MARGHAWWGECVAGGMRGREHALQGVCVAGGMPGMGGMHGRGGVCGRGVCMAAGCMAGGACGRGHVSGCAWWGGACMVVGAPNMWSMCGQYASYWNAFLFFLLFMKVYLSVADSQCIILNVNFNIFS